MGNGEHQCKKSSARCCLPIHNVLHTYVPLSPLLQLESIQEQLDGLSS